MLNDAYSYLINKVSTVMDGYSEMLPKVGQAVAFRSIGGTTAKTLGTTRQYTTFSFNAVVRGEKDSSDIADKCMQMVLLLDMDQSGDIVQCNVTNEPQYAYKDENGNLNYTFNLDVII